jgi:formate-dependent nitrite reductase cytochrome c552 subunit
MVYPACYKMKSIRDKINSLRCADVVQAYHIFYLHAPDNNLLFFEASSDQANEVKTLLNKYELATGQCLIPGKCSLLLGNKCTENQGQVVASILVIQRVGFEEKYLGLPVPEGRMKDGKFQPVKDQKACLRLC